MEEAAVALYVNLGFPQRHHPILSYIQEAISLTYSNFQFYRCTYVMHSCYASIDRSQSKSGVNCPSMEKWKKKKAHQLRERGKAMRYWLLFYLKVNADQILTNNVMLFVGRYVS